MARIIIGAILALLTSFSFSAEIPRVEHSAENPYRWERLNVDPCNPKAGCTLDWALAQTQWPTEVQAGLKDAVKGVTPKSHHVKVGDRLWMTWGQHTKKFQMHTLVAWEQGKSASADLWTFDYRGKQYHLVQVNQCKNWGGWVTTAPAQAPAPKPAVPPAVNLGTIPRIACPS